MSRLALAVFGIGLLASVVAGQPMRDEMAVLDSLSGVHPRLRNRWLNERGIGMPGINAPMPVSGTFAESSGLHLVGKYGRGPSVEVTGRDSLVFLSLGSEVAILNFARPDSPRVLAEVQAMGLATQAALRDSFLYIGCKAGQAGIEVWNVQNPTLPVFRSRTPTLLNDFCVRDTFLYLTQSLSGLNDTFKVYSTSNPDNVYLLGSCRDSGDAVTVTNNTAFLADRWGLYAIDVSNPRNPQHIGAWGSDVMSATARGNLCVATLGNPNQPSWLGLRVLNVANPSNIVQIGSLDSAGGSDMQFSRSVLYVSGFNQGVHEFEVVSLTDSTHPTRLGGLSTPGPNFGVWGDSLLGMAFVADGYEGLSAIDVAIPGSPALLGRSFMAGTSYDVSIDGNIAYVANDQAGLRIVDLSDVTKPRQIAELDSIYPALSCHSAVGRDSFVYSGWFFEFTRTIDVSDPRNPRMAAQFNLFRNAEDMVLRDSFLYVAEDYRFQVVNVARPRSPTVVGTCNLPNYSFDLMVRDTLAFVANGPALEVVSLARPNSPYVVGVWPGHTYGLDLRDTVLYGVGQRVLNAVSVANPAAPYLLDSLPMPFVTSDVIVVESLAYAFGGQVQAVVVSDPRNLRTIGVPWQPPAYIRRLELVPPFIYAAATDGGVCILETLQTGVMEPPEPPRPAAVCVSPSVSAGSFRVSVGSNDGIRGIRVYNVAGNLVTPTAIGSLSDPEVQLDLSGKAGGVYVVALETGLGSTTNKIVITRRR